MELLPLHSTVVSLPPQIFALPTAIHATVASIFDTEPLHANITFSDDVHNQKRRLACFYAIVTFVVSLLRSQSDLQRLYYSRRFTIRCKSELVASVYEKTLVRKDITGITESHREEGKDQKSLKTADVGKIVSLVSSDAHTFATELGQLNVSSSPQNDPSFLLTVPYLPLPDWLIATL